MYTNCNKDNSIFLQRGNTGILLIHGITKTPKELQKLAEKLAGRGFTVHCPLLPKHSTCPKKYETCWRDVLEVTPGELKKSVEDAFLKLEGSVDKIYVGGISLGANLAFHLASRYRVGGIVSMGAAVFLNKGLEFLTTLGPKISGFLSAKNRMNTNNGLVYHNFSVSNLLQMMAFAKEIEKVLPQIDAPTLILHSPRDNLVDPKSATYIYKRIKSKEKKLVWLENMGQGIADAEVCFEEICKFITLGHECQDI